MSDQIGEDKLDLGRLRRVNLRDIWVTEAKEFTPWLAEPHNLDVLSEALGIELELEAKEKDVGSFYADIVCKDRGTDKTVLIENQLEKTNHDHLGKVLTYSAGLQAETVIWLAERFREEHRAALDWLNEISHQNTQFFGLEIELWCIGDSVAAPKFNIVSMPNDWTRSVTEATGNNKEFSELRLLQLEYWGAFLQTLQDANGPVSGNRKPQPQMWMSYGVGTGGYHLGTAIHEKQNYVKVELYIEGIEAEKRLVRLQQEKDEIEHNLGFELIWGDQTATARDRKISCYLRDVDPREKATWPEQHRWLADRLNTMHRVFEPRLGSL